MNDDAVEVVPVVVVDLAVPWWWRYQQIGMIRTVVNAALVVVVVAVVVSSLHGTITLYIRRLHNCVVRSVVEKYKLDRRLFPSVFVYVMVVCFITRSYRTSSSLLILTP